MSESGGGPCLFSFFSQVKYHVAYRCGNQFRDVAYHACPVYIQHDFSKRAPDITLISSSAMCLMPQISRPRKCCACSVAAHDNAVVWTSAAIVS